MQPGTYKSNITGDDSTKPDKSSVSKSEKQETIDQVKSKIKSQANTDTPLRSAVQNCPLASTASKVTPKTTPATKKAVAQCNLSGLTVLKDERTFNLQVNSIPNACTYGNLEVVAGYNKKVATISCYVMGPVGPCEESHKNKVIDFNDHYIFKSDRKLQFKAASFFAFNFFPWKPTVHTYNVAANTCGSGVRASIIVYPDTYWHLKVTTTFEGKKLDEITIEGDYREDQNNLTFSASTSGEVSVDFKNDTTHAAFERDSDSFKAGYKDANTTVGMAASDSHVESFYDNKSTGTTSHFSADTNSLGPVQGVRVNEMSYQAGETKFKLDERLRKNINSLYQTIKVIKFIEGLIDKLSKSGASPVSFELKWPNIELEGTWQWKEIPGSPKCGFEFDISGGLHPLIGCEVDIDLLGAVLKSIPGYGAIINRILDAVEYVTGDDLIINLKLTGELNCDFSINKPASATDPNVNMPDVHIDIIVELSALLKSKRHHAFIGYGGGATGEAKIVITLHKPVVQISGILVPCDYKFDGITLFTVKYVRESSAYSDELPDEDGEIVEEKEQIGHWLEGESHAFSVALI